MVSDLGLILVKNIFFLFRFTILIKIKHFFNFIKNKYDINNIGIPTALPFVIYPCYLLIR